MLFTSASHNLVSYKQDRPNTNVMIAIDKLVLHSIEKISELIVIKRHDRVKNHEKMKMLFKVSLILQFLKDFQFALRLCCSVCVDSPSVNESLRKNKTFSKLSLTRFWLGNLTSPASTNTDKNSPQRTPMKSEKAIGKPKENLDAMNMTRSGQHQNKTFRK